MQEKANEERAVIPTKVAGATLSAGRVKVERRSEFLWVCQIKWTAGKRSGLVETFGANAADAMEAAYQALEKVKAR